MGERDTTSFSLGEIGPEKTKGTECAVPFALFFTL